MAQRHDESSDVLWFVAGLAVGTTLSLLFAPRSGSETRALIGERARESRESLETRGREMLDRSRELFERGREIADEASEMFERGRRLVQD